YAGLRDDPRLDSHRAIREAIKCNLDQTEGEPERGVAVDQLGHCADVLVHAVPCYQQKELAAPHRGACSVNELLLCELPMAIPNQIEGHVVLGGFASVSSCSGHLPLQVRVRPTADRLSVVQDLRDHLPARLRIAPELALQERQAPKGVDES